MSTDGRLNRVHTWEKPINDTAWWLGFVLRASFWLVPRVCCHAVLVSRLRENGETGTAAAAALLLVRTKLSSFYLSVFLWLCFCLPDVVRSSLCLSFILANACKHTQSYESASFLGQCCVSRLKVTQHNSRHWGNIINDIHLIHTEETMRTWCTRGFICLETQSSTHTKFEKFSLPLLILSWSMYVAPLDMNWPQSSDWCVILDRVLCCALYSVFWHSGDSSVSCQYSDLWDGIVQMLLSRTRRFPARGNSLL